MWVLPEADLLEDGGSVMVTAKTVGTGVSVSVIVGVRVMVGVEVEDGKARVGVADGRCVGVCVGLVKE